MRVTHTVLFKITLVPARCHRKTVGKPVYHEDGRVEVIRSVKMRTLVESIKQSLSSGNSAVSREYLTEEIDALGNAAIPNSDGHARVMANAPQSLTCTAVWQSVLPAFSLPVTPQ